MVDPQQTQPIPTDNQATPQTPGQEADFFGGGEEAFHNDAVLAPQTPPQAQPTTPTEHKEIPQAPVVEEELSWDPVLPPAENVPQAPKKDTHIPQDPTHPVAVVQEPIPHEEAVPEEEPMMDIKNQSHLGQKFMELFHLTKKVYELHMNDEGFTLLGADNDKVRIVYTFSAGDNEYPLVSIIKTETDKGENEEHTNEISLYLNEAGTFLNINLNESLFFDEENDLEQDAKKKMQIMEKINKFIFLLGEEQKRIEKELKEKASEQEEVKKLQDVFRNF